jgi:flagellar basal-body rod protein FlgB
MPFMKVERVAMFFNDIPLVRGLGTQMHWLNERQKLVARNLSMADMPGATAVDLKPLTFEQMVKGGSTKQLPALTTNSRHLKAFIDPNNNADMTKEKNFALSPSGNSIDLEQQLFNMNQTSAIYNTAVSVYRKNIAMLRTAIGKAA